MIQVDNMANKYGRYPTWGEWLQSIGVAQLGSGMLSIHPATAGQPIPVEIAKKLGLNPKEG